MVAAKSVVVTISGATASLRTTSITAIVAVFEATAESATTPVLDSSTWAMGGTSRMARS